jgi:hypothetical protein
MRHLIAVIASGFIVWLLASKGVPPIDSGPRPQVVHGGSEASDRQAVQNAVGAGKLHEDPQRRALRRAVLTAANRAEASPCDTRRRKELSDAFDAYHRHMAATTDDRVETLTLRDGRVIDVSHHFDEPVEDAWRYALTAPCDH